jgi:YbbR domain-containing protein
MRFVRFVIHNWPLKIAAIFLAVVLYVGMVALQSTQQWPGTIAIDVVHQPANSYLIKPNPLPEVTGIRYIAAPDVPVTRDSFRAIMDLTKATVSESQDSLVSIQLIAQDPRIQVIDYQPQQIRVALDPIVHKQVSVQVDTGVVPSGLQPGSPILSVSTVDVYGAASIVRQVAYAAAPVRVDASGLDVNEDVDLVARDASNNPVSGVQFNPPSVHVDIPVGSQLQTESVAVNPVITGSPAAGYYISSIDVSPSVVSVRGQADALAGLKGIANTQAISVSGATADVSAAVTLDLPAGVTAIAPTQITAVVHLQSPAATRSVSVGVAPEGARADRIYTLSTPSVTVTLGGAVAALNAFDTSTLVGSVSVGSLDVGTYTLNVSITVPPGIKVVTVSPAQITVTVSAAAPSPTASPH